MVSREMERECVVVFDEAHNIDNVCIEALSGGCRTCCAGPRLAGWKSQPAFPAPATPALHAVNLRQQTLDSAGRNIATLRREIERVKETDAGRLKAEYQRLLSGLQAQGALEQEDTQVRPGAATSLPDTAWACTPGSPRRGQGLLGLQPRVVGASAN